MNPNQKNDGPTPYHIANQKTISLVESILFAMKQPMNQNVEKQNEHITRLKEVLKEILETTQKLLFLNNAGKIGIKADPVGWTTASTDFDKEEVLKNLPHGKIVNKLLRDLLDEQEKKALDKGVAVSEQQILEAQADSLDKSKDKITLETLVDPEAGYKSKVEICKETGDTQLYRQDPETGFWHKVGDRIKGYWQNVKNFASNIWNWITKQFKRAKEWLCGLFKAPEDQQVIYQQVA